MSRPHHSSKNVQGLAAFDSRTSGRLGRRASAMTSFRFISRVGSWDHSLTFALFKGRASFSRFSTPVEKRETSRLPKTSSKIFAH